MYSGGCRINVGIELRRINGVSIGGGEPGVAAIVGNPSRGVLKGDRRASNPPKDIPSVVGDDRFIILWETCWYNAGRDDSPTSRRTVAARARLLAIVSMGESGAGFARGVVTFNLEGEASAAS